MAYLDACWFVAGSSGLSDFADGTAQVGFRNLAGAGAEDGERYSYRAESLDRTQWEMGTGLMNSGVLERETVVISSSANAKVNFSSTVLVSLQPMAAELTATPPVSAIHTGDDTTGPFELLEEPGAPELLSIFVNGLKQPRDGTVYTLSGNEITWIEAVPNGVIWEEVIEHVRVLTLPMPGADSVGATQLQTGAVTTTKILNGAVTLAKMEDEAEATMLGRAAGAGTGAPEHLSAAQIRTLIDILGFTGTFTNKRITPRIGTTASSSTPTADADAHDQYNVTAAAAGMTVGAPTGTPTDGQKLLFRFKDDGTARTLAFNAIFRAVGVTLPTTTTISKTLYVGAVYNAADTKWDVLAVGLEA